MMDRLPYEILCEVARLMPNVETALTFMRASRRIHSVFNPTTEMGNRIWKSLRQKEGWPDPSMAMMTDYDFIRAIYGRGCQNCSRHPRIASPIWEFKGIRLCSCCFVDLTIRDYELTPYERFCCEGLPYVKSSVFAGGYPRVFAYRSYLRSQLLTAQDDANLPLIHRFRKEVEERRWQIREARSREKQEILRLKREAIERFLVERFPAVEPELYGSFESFRAICKSTTPFSTRAQAIFLPKFTRELAGAWTYLWRVPTSSIILVEMDNDGNSYCGSEDDREHTCSDSCDCNMWDIF